METMKISDHEDIVEFDRIPIPFFKELLPLTDPFANQIINHDNFSDSGNNQRDDLLNSLHECDTYKELSKSIIDPEDIIEFDQIQNMIDLDDIIKEIVDYRMQLLFEAFEHVGFSKDYILAHSNEFHSQKFLSTDSYIFYHYNERLFDICISSGFDYKDMYSFMYSINGWITYYNS